MGVSHEEKKMANTYVKYAAYRNGARICESSRTFNGHVTASYAKTEIAKAHGGSSVSVEILSLEHK